MDCALSLAEPLKLAIEVINVAEDLSRSRRARLQDIAEVLRIESDLISVLSAEIARVIIASVLHK
jgi:hypothetical protein